MGSGIPGISRTSLWRTWKELRRRLKDSSIRDVIDFLDYDVEPEVWIKRLVAQIAAGHYEPQRPTRFTLGKSRGFSRTMTLPAIPDLVLYRTIVDYIYARSRRRQRRHVYFLRSQLADVQRRVQLEEQQAGLVEWDPRDDPYRLSSRDGFERWKEFNQYRKYLILEKLHPFIVVADIANFFDTVLHSHVAEAVRGLQVPPRMTGLLFFLLERLSIQQDYSSSHGISLPTDEFDCSRTLAHMVLYPHDDAIVTLAGEDNYVRWMDDQNVGVESRAEGLIVLREVGRSLARLHLTPTHPKIDGTESRRSPKALSF